MRRPPPPTPAVAVPGESCLSDDAVIAKASTAKNGEKFCRLWDGNTTGYKSQSEADAALLSILAFWCSGDKVHMDRLFQQSVLMQEKWGSLRGADTYGNLSIEKSVARITDYYKPIISRSTAEDFDVDHLKELDPTNQSKYPWNDIDACHIFTDFYQDRLRYIPERKSRPSSYIGILSKQSIFLKSIKYRHIRISPTMPIFSQGIKSLSETPFRDSFFFKINTFI